MVPISTSSIFVTREFIINLCASMREVVKYEYKTRTDKNSETGCGICVAFYISVYSLKYSLGTWIARPNSGVLI